MKKIIEVNSVEKSYGQTMVLRSSECGANPVRAPHVYAEKGGYSRDVSSAELSGQQEKDTRTLFLTVFLSGIMAGVLSSAVGIFPAIPGWKRRPATATILCALLIVCLVTNLIVIFPDRIILVLLGMSVASGAVAAPGYHNWQGGLKEWRCRA